MGAIRDRPDVPRWHDSTCRKDVLFTAIVVPLITDEKRNSFLTMAPYGLTVQEPFNV